MKVPDSLPESFSDPNADPVELLNGLGILRDVVILLRDASAAITDATRELGPPPDAMSPSWVLDNLHRACACPGNAHNATPLIRNTAKAFLPGCPLGPDKHGTLSTAEALRAAHQQAGSYLGQGVAWLMHELLPLVAEAKGLKPDSE